MRKFHILKVLGVGLGQSILIIVSVLIAAWVENLREERREKELGKVLLLQMAQELKDDTKTMLRVLPITRNQKIAAEGMAKALLTGGIPIDSIRKYTAKLNWYADYYYNTATYQTFKSIGFNLIKNDHLCLEIVHYYQHRTELTRNLARVSYEQLFYSHVPSLLEHFKEFSMVRGSVPIDFDKLRRDNKVIEFFRIYHDLLDVQYQSEKDLIEQTQHLIRNVEQELAED